MAAIRLLEKYRVIFSRFFLLCVGIVLIFIGSKQTPLMGTIFFMFACFLAGLASLGRLWCSLYISGYKDQTLVTTGPYSLCRNPLYFSSFVGTIGVGLATGTITIPLLLAALFAFYYPLVIKSEEMRLASIHKERFEHYCRTTPAFLPRMSILKEPADYRVMPIIFRKNLVDAVWFVWLVGIFAIFAGLRAANLVPVLFHLY